MAEFDSACYREVVRLVRKGHPPLQMLQAVARRRGMVIAVPLALAEWLDGATTGEAISLFTRAGERAAERERLNLARAQHTGDLGDGGQAG